MNDIEAAKKLFFEGMDFFDAGDLGNAESRLLEAVRLAPQNNSVITNLAVVLARQNKFPEARAQARTAIADNERNIEALLVLSACCLHAKDPQFDEILSLADRIIEIEPGNSDGHSYRGLALAHYGRFAEALEDYDRAIALNPGHAHYFTNRGNALLELKRYAEALAAHDKALTLKPDMAEAWLGRGYSLFELNHDEEALACFQKTTSLAPDFAPAWIALAKLYQRVDQNDRAIAAYKKASEADPEDRYGAKLYLMRLGAGEFSGMSPAFVRMLFDEYSQRFEKTLTQDLGYRGPQILLKAVLGACKAAGRDAFFKRAIDLGCGTGLVAREFAPNVGEFIGIDLSPGMIEQARQGGFYNRLEITDMVQGLAKEPQASADLVIVADAAIYLSDLVALAIGAARVLNSGGLFALTTETHDGNGVILGAGLRYAHGADHVRASIAQSGLALVDLTSISVRNENNAPVPGLVAVARKV